MTHAGYVFSGYAITVVATLIYAVSVLRRARRVGQQVAREEVPWANGTRRPMRLSRLQEESSS